jgi:hypothetical protein
MTVDLQPDELEALQAEPASEPPVRVEVSKIEGPVRTQDLPRKSGATRTRTVGTTPIKLLSGDHRRAVARLVSIGQPMLLAFNMASAADPSTMALWPANLQFTLTADTELWAAAQSATTSISIVTEYWAAGE